MIKDIAYVRILTATFSYSLRSNSTNQPKAHYSVGFLVGKPMIKTFPWQMDMGATADKQYRVNKTQFGDGYAQLSSIGINNKTKNWSGTKTGALDSVIKPIEAFIDEHAGAKPFLWTDPHGNTKQYTCAGVSIPQRKGDHWQITLNFEQFNNT